MHPLLTQPSSFLISSASILRFFLIPLETLHRPDENWQPLPSPCSQSAALEPRGPDSRFLGFSPIERREVWTDPRGSGAARLGKRLTIAFQQGCAAYLKIVSASALLIRIL